MYTSKVIEHFRHPKNFGKMKNPDGVGKVGNIVCGDILWLYIKVGKNKKSQEILKDIKFQTFGCVASIATSSIITEMAKGKTLSKAININKEEIIKALGGLPPVKLHCSLLAVDALSEAIYNYLAKQKREIPEILQKRHQRIKKEKELIEEKYKDWLTTEEKLKKEI